jgi:ribonuclease HI
MAHVRVTLDHVDQEQCYIQPQETGNAKRIHTAGRACGIAALKDGFTDIKILSDSQTAVGILTLNWKSSNYIDTISDIKENLGTLMRYGMRTTLSWIPGHANIAGNEIANQLAKEAKTLLLIKQHITYMNISRYANIDN